MVSFRDRCHRTTRSSALLLRTTNKARSCLSRQRPSVGFSGLAPVRGTLSIELTVPAGHPPPLSVGDSLSCSASSLVRQARYHRGPVSLTVPQTTLRARTPNGVFARTTCKYRNLKNYLRDPSALREQGVDALFVCRFFVIAIPSPTASRLERPWTPAPAAGSIWFPGGGRPKKLESRHRTGKALFPPVSKSIYGRWEQLHAGIARDGSHDSSPWRCIIRR